MGFSQAGVARATHATHAYSLGNGSLNPRPLTIGVPKVISLFALAGMLQGLMHRLWAKGQSSFNPPGTAWSKLTNFTSSRREMNPNNGCSILAKSFCPDHATLIGGAGHRLSLPVNGKLKYIQTIFGLGLPTGIRATRPKQVDSVLLLAMGQVFGIHITRINQMNLGT